MRCWIFSSWPEKRLLLLLFFYFLFFKKTLFSVAVNPGGSVYLLNTLLAIGWFSSDLTSYKEVHLGGNRKMTLDRGEHCTGMCYAGTGPDYTLFYYSMFFVCVLNLPFIFLMCFYLRMTPRSIWLDAFLTCTSVFYNCQYAQYEIDANSNDVKLCSNSAFLVHFLLSLCFDIGEFCSAATE